MFVLIVVFSLLNGESVVIQPPTAYESEEVCESVGFEFARDVLQTLDVNATGVQVGCKKLPQA